MRPEHETHLTFFNETYQESFRAVEHMVYMHQTAAFVFMLRKTKAAFHLTILLAHIR
jgi:hypothetical protein